MMHLLSLDSLSLSSGHSNGSGVGTSVEMSLCFRPPEVNRIPAGRNSVGHGVTLFKNDDQTQR